ncbi:MAG: hypothetical protein HKO57_00420, partial [Akkermansiaceae bacterium]|nr:hypothetical protein [Akkermansiaceae bacterium]
GAARGAGQVFYRFDMTRSAGAEWGGVSSMDFGAERLFFGVPGADFANDNAGLEISGGGGTALTGINLVDGQTYTMVAAIDFDNGLVGLFVNPTGFSDFWNPADGSNSADATLAYTGTNWSTGVRLASGGSDVTTWDNLTVALNDPNDVRLSVPEPAAGLLGGLAGLLLLRRRR